jgi:hypothetical protein
MFCLVMFSPFFNRGKVESISSWPITHYKAAPLFMACITQYMLTDAWLYNLVKCVMLTSQSLNPSPTMQLYLPFTVALNPSVYTVSEKRLSKNVRKLIGHMSLRWVHWLLGLSGLTATSCAIKKMVLATCSPHSPHSPHVRRPQLSARKSTLRAMFDMLPSDSQRASAAALAKSGSNE